VFKVAPPPPDATGSGGGTVALKLALGGAVLLAAGVLYRVVAASKAPASRTPGQPRAGDGYAGANAPAHARRFERPHEEHRGEPVKPPAQERPQEVLNRYLQARDSVSAARLCESLGLLEKAAACHRESGNVMRARELYLELKDYRKAAELYEQSGEDLRAAELYEAAAHSTGGDSALNAARLFQKAGNPDRALQIHLKANHFAEAAAIFEERQDFHHAAEHYLKAGDVQKAAECYDKAGDPRQCNVALSKHYYDQGLVREAAECSEKAGDLMQAATMYQEAGDLAKAGDLFFQAGFYDEAGEIFVQLDDAARAAEAFERSGRHLQAAQLFEKAGGDKERIAGLYEKGEDYYAAGRLFVKLGQLDRALNALQQVDPASGSHRSASLLVGMIFLKRGQTKLAYEKFTKIIDNQPVSKANLEPYYFLALCHQKAGDAEKAKAIFERILAEDYNFRDVRKRTGG